MSTPVPNKKKNKSSRSKKTAAPAASPVKGPQPFKVRRSKVHGSGAFAIRDIKKGEAVAEYKGERISHKEADRRHAKKRDDDNHTFLFTIDSKIVIDATADGNDARFINHACDPNCEVYIVNKAPVIEALRNIKSGEELNYDYNLTRDGDESEESLKLFACRCGSPKCRGSMLAPPPKKKKSAKKKAASKTKAGGAKKPKKKAGAKKSKKTSR